MLAFDERAQSPHLGGRGWSDELEATHQRVSPAKYSAAQRRIFRSVVSLACSTWSSAIRARSQASSVWGDSGSAVGSVLVVGGLDWSGLEV